MTVAGMPAAGPAAAWSANPTGDVAKKAECAKCHALAGKKMGPPFKFVSAKYKGKAGSDAALVANSQSGQGTHSGKASADDPSKLAKRAPGM